MPGPPSYPSLALRHPDNQKDLKPESETHYRANLPPATSSAATNNHRARGLSFQLPCDLPAFPAFLPESHTFLPCEAPPLGRACLSAGTSVGALSWPWPWNRSVR